MKRLTWSERSPCSSGTSGYDWLMEPGIRWTRSRNSYGCQATLSSGPRSFSATRAWQSADLKRTRSGSAGETLDSRTQLELSPPLRDPRNSRTDIAKFGAIEELIPTRFQPYRVGSRPGQTRP